MHTITKFRRDHLNGALELSQAVNWPHRLVDWQMLLGLSAGVVALRDNVVVGTALRSDFGPDVSTSNMIIVKDTERSQGLGRRLMDASMASDTREHRLVATREGMPLYEKLGFSASGDIAQHQGMVGHVDAPDMPVRLATTDELPEIAALESSSFGADRNALVAWLAEHGRLLVVGDGKVEAYAALRPFGRGHVVGPVVAPGIETAQALILAAAQSVKDRMLRIDTETSLGLTTWLEDLGLPQVGGGVAMRRHARSSPAPRFGLFSQALG